MNLNVVVLSGGLDSATALAMANEDSRAVTKAVTFDYGQKHAREMSMASELARHYGLELQFIELPHSLFRGGSLTTGEEIKDMRYDDLPSGEMSPTYVPFRNANLISMAVAYADGEVRRHPAFEKATVWAGMHAEDAQGFAYADCTPEFLGAMTSAVYIGTYGRVRFHAPFQASEKWEIIQKGMELNVPYELTHSCYRGGYPACGACSTCHARLEAFAQAGFQDPIAYVSV